VPKSGTNVRFLAGPTIHVRGPGMALRVDSGRPAVFACDAYGRIRWTRFGARDP